MLVYYIKMFWFMVLHATFNNISAISWQSVLLVVETGIPGEKHRLVARHWQSLSNNVVSESISPKTGVELTILVVIGTDFTGSNKSNYHTITTTMAPYYIKRNYQNWLKNKFSTYKDKKLPFWHLFFVVDFQLIKSINFVEDHPINITIKFGFNWPMWWFHRRPKCKSLQINQDDNSSRQGTQGDSNTSCDPLSQAS